MTSWWEVAVPAGAGLIGALVGGGFTLAGQSLNLRNERGARQRAREQQLVDERRAYELARMDELRTVLAIVNESHPHAMRQKKQQRQGALGVSPSALALAMGGPPEPIDRDLAAEFAPAILRLRAIALVVLDPRVRNGCLQVADTLPRLSDQTARQANIDEAYSRIGARTRELYDDTPGPDPDSHSSTDDPPAHDDDQEQK